MRSPNDAMARGGLLRMETLRSEGRTRDALRVARRLQGKISVSTVANSPEAYLRQQFKYEYARLLIREGTRGSIEKGKALIYEAYEAVGFEAELQDRRPAIEGERRIVLLADIAVGLGEIGEHSRAISIGTAILERAEGSRSLARIQTELNNLASRWTDQGYVYACADRADWAAGAYQKALGYIDRAIREAETHLGDSSDQTREASLLIRVSNRLRVRIEQASLKAQVGGVGAETDQELENLYAEAKDLMRRSDANPICTPGERSVRFKRLGSVLVEIARATAASDPDRAAGYAMSACVFLKQRYDSHLDDADVPPSLIVRYADACRMSGDVETARDVLSLGLDRLERKCGTDYAPCLRIRERLLEIDAL